MNCEENLKMELHVKQKNIFSKIVEKIRYLFIK